MLGFEIADRRRCGRVAHFELLEDHTLLRVMAGIRVVLKVVDGREDDLVIRSFAAIERNQFPFQNPKQLFNVAMVPDEEPRRCMSSRTAPARPSSRSIDIDTRRCTTLR